jgi:hypothetical protein
MIGPIAPGALQPETAITANQQVANLVARLRKSNKARAPNGTTLRAKFHVNIW